MTSNGRRSEMTELDKIEIKPHPALKLIKSHKIPLVKVAAFVGLSYHHCSHILNGHYKPGKRGARRLNELIKHLKKKEAANDKGSGK